MNQKYFWRILPILLSAAVLLFFFTASVTAETEEAIKKEKQNDATEQSPTLSGAKYARDEDGAIRRPTSSENRILSSKIRKTLQKYSRHQVKTGKNGMSLVIAPYNFRWSVATVGPDGKVQYDCAENTNEIDVVADSQAKTDSQAEKE